MNKKYLQEAAQAASEKLPDQTRLILFTLRIECDETIVHYASDIERSDAIAALKTWLFHQGEKENWMQHIR